MESKIQRVFIHELGHFISNEMNRKFYSNFLGTESILIYRCQQNFNEFCGLTRPNKPEKYDVKDKKVPFERLPNFLVSLMYGCVLQSVFQDDNLEKCLINYGICDLKELNGNLISYSISFVNVEIYKILEDYVIQCKKAGLFKFVLNLKYSDFILDQIDDEYRFDICKLNDSLNEFYYNHYSCYKNLILEIENILAQVIKSTN